MVGAFALLAVAIVAHGDAEGVVVAAKALGSHAMPADGAQSFASNGDEAEFRIVPLEGAAIPEPSLPHHKWRGVRTAMVDKTPDPPVVVKPPSDPPPADDLTLAGTPKTDPCDELCLWRIACKELQSSGRDCGPAPGSP